MNTTVAGGVRPETLLESAQFAEKAALELNTKLRVFIRAVSSEPTIGKVFAESVEFEKVAKVADATDDTQSENSAVNIAEELESLAVACGRVFKSSLDDDTSDDYLRWRPVSSLLRTLLKHSEVCSSLIVDQGDIIRGLKRQLGKATAAPNQAQAEEFETAVNRNALSKLAKDSKRREEGRIELAKMLSEAEANVEPTITRKVLLNRIKGLKEQAESSAAFSKCLADSIDDCEWEIKSVATELAGKLDRLYSATMDASDGEGDKSLHEVIL